MFKGHNFPKPIILQDMYFKFTPLLEKEINKENRWETLAYR